MSGFETISQGILLTFALVVILMPSFIRLLRRFGMGKRVRVDGPETHYVKEGTPSMGGLLIIGDDAAPAIRSERDLGGDAHATLVERARRY